MLNAARTLLETTEQYGTEVYFIKQCKVEGNILNYENITKRERHVENTCRAAGLRRRSPRAEGFALESAFKVLHGSVFQAQDADCPERRPVR